MKDKELKQLIKEEIKLVMEDKRAEIDAIVKLDHALLGAKQVSLRSNDLKDRFPSHDTSEFSPIRVYRMFP